MLSILIPSLMVTSLYMVMMLLFLRGWQKLEHPKKKTTAPSKKVSVIISLRNEEDQISGLIESLQNQDYLSNKLEYIFVDDHSTDNTLKNLEASSISLSNIKILPLPQGQQGKKAALRYANKFATGEILLFSDADSRHESSWCTSMLRSFSDEKSQLVLGPVMLKPANSFFQKIQQLDFMSMVITGAGSVGIGRPVLAFGPNIAISKDLYNSVVVDIMEDIPSGDDMFILEAVKRRRDISIAFTKDKNAIVGSPPSLKFSHFWNQRKRWVSKSEYYTDRDIILVSLLVYLQNLIILASLILSLLKISPWWPFPCLLLAKTLAELPLIIKGGKFFNIPNVVQRFIFTQLFYYLYITLILPAGIIGSFKWKNRNS